MPPLTIVMTWVSNGRRDNVLMRLADQFLLAQIRERLLSHIPDDQWKLVEEEVDKAGGVREVEGYTGVLLKDAISKASFGGDRSAAGRYAANQRWQGQGKGEKNPQSQPRYGGKTPREGARLTESEKAELPSRDLAYLANTIISDLKTQGKSIPSAAAPYLLAMRTMGSINENYGADSGASIVAYLLSNLASYKGETAKAIKAELKSRMKNQRLSDMEPNPNRSLGRITATDPYGRTQEIQSDKGEAPSGKTGFDEDDFADKKAFANRKDSETYKKTVENNIKQIERKDGVPRYKGSGTDLKSAKQELDNENEMLQAFENKTATTRRLLGGNYKRSDARAIIQARIASAEAKVQALEEFDDRTTPGFNAD